jgi:multidrug efflux pump subunit AcrA (membrane-fusion protein)
MKTEGKVVEIVPAIDPMTRTFLVRIELNGKGLRSGLYGKVKFPVGVKQAIFVPAEAVVEKGQLTGVYAVDEDGMVTYRLVRVGKQYRDMVEILSGITSGDRVIVKGVEEAIDGGVLKEVSEE